MLRGWGAGRPLKPGDVVIGAFPGVQTTKARPAVVLSTESYHLDRPDVIVGIIPTQDPRPSAPADCLLADWTVAGLHAPSWFRMFLGTLPRTSVRKLGRLSPRDWTAVQTCCRKGFSADGEGFHYFAGKAVCARFRAVLRSRNPDRKLWAAVKTPLHCKSSIAFVPRRSVNSSRKAYLKAWQRKRIIRGCQHAGRYPFDGR